MERAYRRLALLLLATSACTVPSPAADEPAPSSVTAAGADTAATPVPDAGIEFDRSTALGLAALPLACLDRPQSAPRGTGYLYERTPQLRLGFDRERAFYGCYDWHSAVNSTWALVAILDRFPDLPVAPLIVEKLDAHLSEAALAGELEFFQTDGNRTFERPYGWAWLLKLQSQLSASQHPRSASWAAATAPLAEVFARGLIGYTAHLDYPMRIGTHANTAFALDLALGYAEQTGDAELASTIRASARRLFIDDVACPLAYEPSAADFLSPCLEEAKLMAAVLEGDERTSWLQTFLEPNDLAPMATAIELADPDAELDIGQMGAKSHLIGLMFTRAEALQRIAAVLPPDHPLGVAAREVAAASGGNGMHAMFEAGYLGSHWLGTFAVKYLVSLP